MDLFAVDVFGNQIKDIDLRGTSAKFVYGKSTLSLRHTYTPGIIHLYSENEQQNSIFKALPPREDFYTVVVRSKEAKL